MNALPRMAVTIGLGLLFAAGVQAEDWKLVKDESGIQVYLKEVVGSQYKAYRGVATIAASMAKVRALQDDAGGACAWIHECNQQKLLKHEGAESWTYTRFNTPWPVAPRDSVLHITSREEADGSLTRVLQGVPEYLPEEDGFVRVSKVEGVWKLTPKGPGSVEVIYEVHSEPGGSVPSWLANSFVVDAPFNTLEGLRQRAEKP
ncbi:MAG: START domain-containing protein [Pseudomonas sp.]|uniref:START domain-containing protein n=1 Tax=Pseudomonas sp. TaxID=306 RepID=UPI00339A47D2